MTEPLGLGYTEEALTYLESVPKKIRGQIIKKCEALRSAPRPAGSKVVQGQSGDDGEIVYRERSGDYRMLYVVRESQVIVLDIDHRKDVYR